MRVLKSMSWDDRWSQYIMGEAYGGMRLDMLSTERYGIIFVMQQLREKMTVYEAFLKGVEAVASRESIKKSIIKQISKAEKQIEKNRKEGICNEELEAVYAAVIKGLGVKKLEEWGECSSYCTEDGNNAGCDAVLRFDAFNASKEEMMGVMRGKGRSRLQMLHDAVVGMVDAGVSCEEIASRLNGVAGQEEIEKVYEIVKHEKSEK